jgi:hypothetical protein
LPFKTITSGQKNLLVQQYFLNFASGMIIASANFSYFENYALCMGKNLKI